MRDLLIKSADNSTVQTDMLNFGTGLKSTRNGVADFRRTLKTGDKISVFTDDNEKYNTILRHDNDHSATITAMNMSLNNTEHSIMVECRGKLSIIKL